MNDERRPVLPPPASPCLAVCRMDADDRFCAGCLRTRSEIASWWSLADDDKRRVLAALPERVRLRR